MYTKIKRKCAADIQQEPVACAAAKAAAYMLLSGGEVKEIKVITPMGVSLTLPVIDIDIKEDKVICAIKKDSGDDPM